MIQLAVCSIRILNPQVSASSSLPGCLCLLGTEQSATLHSTQSPSSHAPPPPSVVTLSRSGGSPPPPAPGPPAAAGSRRSLCVRYLDMATSVWPRPVLAGRWRTYTGDGEPHQHGAHPHVHQHLQPLLLALPARVRLGPRLQQGQQVRAFRLQIFDGLAAGSVCRLYQHCNI